MQRRISVVSIAAAIFLAACATDDVVAPAKVPRAATLSKSAGTNSDNGDFVVLMTGQSINPGFEARVKSLGGKVTRAHAGAGIASVSGLTDAAAAQLAATTGVSQVKRDIVVSLDLPTRQSVVPVASVIGSRIGSGQASPTTAAFYAFQWNMRLIGADKAWAAGKFGSSTITVAILDTGIDYDSPDLNGKVDLSRSISYMGPVKGEAMLSDDEITDKFFPTRNKISDYEGHGTNVATQVSSNAALFAGVTSKTRLIGVKVLGADGSGSFGGIFSGILWAADHHANVANLSLGATFGTAGNGAFIDYIARVFEYAKQKSMLVVVAAGNDGSDLDNNGANYVAFCDAPHVLCVSAVGPTRATKIGTPEENAPAFFTNYGATSISVAAPGGNGSATASDWPWGKDNYSRVWSDCSSTLIVGFDPDTGLPDTPCKDGGYIIGAVGTSQAAPHAAGLAALLISVTGESKSMEIRQDIEETSYLPTIFPQKYYGKGRIDVWKAVRGQSSGSGRGSR
jgi:subtilisin family serine protease